MNQAIHKAQIHPSAYIGPFCIIGYPAENRATWPQTPFGVVIKQDAILAGAVTVDAGTVRDTVVGERCFLMKGAHLGHDVILAEDVTIACGAKIGGHVTIGKGANIGLNAIVHPRQSIPPFCMLGAGTVITKTAVIKPFDVWAGNPGRFLKFNSRGVEKFGLTDSEVQEIIEAWQQNQQV